MGAPPAVPRTAESDGAPPEGGSAVQHGGEWFDFTERPSGVWYWDSRNPKGPFIAATSREGLILTALYHAQQRIAELERMLQAERDAGDIVRASNAEMLAEIGRLEAELARLTQAGPIPDDAICMIRPHGISGMLDGTGVIEQPTRYATARWWRVTYKVPDTRLVVVDRPATAGEAKADG